MDRRGFIKKSGACALCAGMAQVLSQCASSSDVVLVGDMSDEGALVVKQDRVDSAPERSILLQHPDSRFPTAVIRNSEGSYYALLMSCTHMQCVTEVQVDHIICPCHGAKSSRGGKVMQGPATRDLKSYPVRHSGGKLYIYLS